MNIEQAKLVEILPTVVRLEHNFLGQIFVVLQHQGDEPFDYCVFNYDYRYTSNSSIHNAAESMAKSLGATEPILYKDRPLKGPSE